MKKIIISALMLLCFGAACGQQVIPLPQYRLRIVPVGGFTAPKQGGTVEFLITVPDGTTTESLREYVTKNIPSTLSARVSYSSGTVSGTSATFSLAVTANAEQTDFVFYVRFTGNQATVTQVGTTLFSVVDPGVRKIVPDEQTQIALDGSDNGVRYELLKDDALLEMKIGTGRTIAFEGKYTPGVYTIRTGSGVAMKGKVEIRLYSFFTGTGLMLAALQGFPDLTNCDKNGGSCTLKASYATVSELTDFQAMAAKLNTGDYACWDGNFMIEASPISEPGALNVMSVRITWGPNTTISHIAFDTGLLLSIRNPRSGLITTRRLLIGQPTGGTVERYPVSGAWDEQACVYRVSVPGSQYRVNYTLRLEKDSVTTLVGNGNPLVFDSITRPGNYYVWADYRNVRYSMPLPGVAVCKAMDDVHTPMTNWVAEKIYLEQGHMTDINYYNGLGEPLQTVQVQANPDRRNLVTPYYYDNMRRIDTRTYLAYPSEHRLGVLESDPLDPEHWKSVYPSDYHSAYGQRVYEASPLNRVKAIVQPGSLADYYQARTTMTYGTNLGNEVLMGRFVQGDGLETDTLCLSGYYPVCSLGKTSISNEDGSSVITFVDKQGQTVLERRIGENGKRHDTYYFYDRMDRLRWVISPEGSARLTAQSILTPGDSISLKYCYIYHYDGRGCIVEKQFPGKRAELMVYDNGDRLRMYVDGNHDRRGYHPVGEAAKSLWQYYEYDALGRPTATWLVSALADPASHRRWFDLDQPEKITFFEQYPFAEYRYDTYAGIPDDLAYATVSSRLDTVDLKRVNGLKTYEKLAVLDGKEFSGQARYVERAFYYDAKGRLVQTVERNPAGMVSRQSQKYSLTGNVLYRYESSADSPTERKNYLETYFTYDHRDRLLKDSTVLTLIGTRFQETRPVAKRTSAVTRYRYNALGQLAGQSCGTDSIVLHDTLTYDVRGWLAERRGNLFHSRLRYSDPRMPGSKRLFSGNISEWEWGYSDTDLPINTYAFTYDRFGRLTDTKQYDELDELPASRSFTEHGISYDANGNILGLKRESRDGQPVQYAYQYDGNRLTTLRQRNPAKEYSYQYDANGNMRQDSRRNFELSYNYLNLVQSVRRGTDTLARYTWLADGTKLSVCGADGRGYDYVGSLIYSNDNGSLTLESAAFPQGQFTAARELFAQIIEPHYFVRDHLGSVRVVVDERGEVKERNNYYPFGSRWDDSTLPVSDNRFRFSGKEEQPIVTSDWLDFGARMYDPAIGRWFVQDRQSDRYFAISPYVYCANNPLKLIDPNGETVWVCYIDEDGNIISELYAYGKKYRGENEFIAVMFQILDAIYRYGGGKALNSLITSGNIYNFTNSNPGVGKFALYKSFWTRPGGNILAGRISIIDGLAIETMAHETFHAIQELEGQGDGSAYNELEAFIFGYTIALKWNFSHNQLDTYKPPYFDSREEKSSLRKAYENQFVSTSEFYTWRGFYYLYENFKSNSRFGDIPNYRNAPNYPRHQGNLKNLIFNYNPNEKQ